MKRESQIDHEYESNNYEMDDFYDLDSVTSITSTEAIENWGGLGKNEDIQPIL